MSAEPKVSVVMPVFNRIEPLGRALASLREQTWEDFECVIVDDASAIDVAPVVEGFADPRFRLVRRETNGGPYAARWTGYRELRGEYVFHLDSDWEAFPWALDQSRRHLDETPEVDGVIGLHLRSSDSCAFVRITDHRRIVTPEMAAEEEPLADRVGVVRRSVVEEWLRKRGDYFALEGHQWLTFALHHNQLYVDEPWTRYDVGGSDRVSLVSTSASSSRQLDDWGNFLDEHWSYIESTPSIALDGMVEGAYFALWRARRPELAKAERALVLRGLSGRKIIARRIAAKAGRAVGRGEGREVAWA